MALTAGLLPMALDAKPPRRWIFASWLLAFYASWAGLVFVAGLWPVVASHWQISVAMAGGSFVGGSSPVAGGTVGFPVLVYLFDHPANLGRMFCLSIQSIGMVSASIYIVSRRRQVEWRLLKSALLGAGLAMPLGLAWVAPMVPDSSVKLVFSVLYASFGLLHLARMGSMVANHGPSPVRFDADPLIGFGVGVLGGLLASIIGVGADILMYGTLVLLYRADIKVAIPTAVILMAFTSLVGAGCSLAASPWWPGGRASIAEAFPFWLAAAPVVVVGGPVGSFVSRFVPRRAILGTVAVLCLSQYALTCYRERIAGGTFFFAALGVLALNLGLHLLHSLGQRSTLASGESKPSGGSDPMSMQRTLAFGVALWVAAITLLHAGMNLGTFTKVASADGSVAPFRVGFIPVTCHLTCPVTHFINEKMTGDSVLEPIRFSGWPELKETFLAKELEATFLLAPLAMSLREQGVPLKIVYLGHRDGTTMMVHKDSPIYKIEDLRGRKIAVPNRFSNQRLIIFKAFRERGIKMEEVTLVEMPPPDMPAALFAKSVDAVISGEPFMAQSEMDGFGRVLFMTKDVWPEFISCVLAVPERIIETRRPDVQRLVDGIAKSGKWLDRDLSHRMQAADFTGPQYYHQDPKLLRFVLSKPPDRVKYTNLAVVRKDFEEIEALGREAGILNGTARFEDYADPSFVRDEVAIQPYNWEAKP